jgi:MscS family membrane protein
MRPLASLRLLILALVLTIAGMPAAAQQLGLPSDPAEVPESEPDILNRDTPRGTVTGLLAALAEQDTELAARYLEAPPGTELDAETIATVERALDVAGRFRPPNELSILPTGDLLDREDPGLERVGTLNMPDGQEPIMARRGPSDQPSETDEASPIWRISEETVALLLSPEIAEVGMGPFGIVRDMIATLPLGPIIGGVPLRDWISLLLIGMLSYLAAWTVTGLLRHWGRKMAEMRMSTRFSRLVVAVEPPIRLLLTAVLFAAVLQGLSVSVIARYQLGWIIQLTGWFSALWILWRVTDAIALESLEQMSRRGALTAYSITTFLNRLVKAVIVLVFIAVALRSFGVDITAGLAALGVGGLALALGAQTLVANLLGSVTLIADRPVRVGDFCSFGTTLGTVEEIGIRSTRIRTLTRTIVTVPNGEFSNLHIENFSLRDRFLFNPTIGLRYETDPATVRRILAALDDLLADTPEVIQDGARVRFVRFAAYSLDLEFFAYVLAADWPAFLEIQEDLMLRVMEIVEAHGSGFAFPSQTVYLGRDDRTAPGAAAPPAPSEAGPGLGIAARR